VLPKGTAVNIDLARVPVSPVFKWLAATGGVIEPEMLRTFNCGIGMVLVVAPSEARAVAAALAGAGETVVTLGKVEAGATGVVYDGCLDLA
jgi:phosphoribosylformylglycinamidine cyclo-ligase